MTNRNQEQIQALAETLGPTEKLLDLIINFPDHLWHNRPGVVVNGKWKAASRAQVLDFNENGRLTTSGGEFRQPGAHVGAIEQVYTARADIWNTNQELAARLASYVMRDTDWRDMKVSAEHSCLSRTTAAHRSSMSRTAIARSCSSTMTTARSARRC